SDTITVGTDLPDSDMGMALINRLMELHIANVSAMRQRQVQLCIAHLEEALEPAKKRLAVARKDYDGFVKDVECRDIKMAYDGLVQEIAALRVALATQRNQQNNHQTLMEKLDRLDSNRAEGNSEALAEMVDKDPGYQARKKSLQESLQKEEAALAET